MARKPSSRLNRSAGRPSTDDVQEIENLILQVALGEFLERGYGGASLTRIVEQAGISKTTLYSRYGSKEELFRAIIFNQINRIDPGSLLKIDSIDCDLEQGLKSYANKMLELNLQGEMLAVNKLINSESSRFPELGAAAAERTRLGVVRIADFIRRCTQADGILCGNPELVAEAFIMMLRGWYMNVLLTNETVTTAKRRKWVEGTVHILLSSKEHW
ncbi:MAG: TetR/AcrR family transcriptional regulator [Ketobacter sp.]|nr:MAG: TetR/AcrR family transcriptional regulator [Ketobacter sp.]